MVARTNESPILHIRYDGRSFDIPLGRPLHAPCSVASASSRGAPRRRFGDRRMAIPGAEPILSVRPKRSSWPARHRIDDENIQC